MTYLDVKCEYDLSLSGSFLLFIAGKFFLYLVFMFLTFTYFTFYGMMAVGLTPSQHLAAVISSAFYSLWNLLSGFLIPKSVSNLTLAEHLCSLSYISSCPLTCSFIPELYS